MDRVIETSGHVAPRITKLSDAIPDHHWCIPFSVAGNPKPTLSWLHDGEEVPEGPYLHTRVHEVSEREFHGCLQLDSPTHLNNGHYTLVATNIYGNVSKVVDAHFMHTPGDGLESDQYYYGVTTEGYTIDPPEDRVAVYVVVGIAAVALVGFLLMLVILKFSGNSKFGIKGKSS
uniref:Immunoglobulin I-set domain-containing protein n=1 Tax=Knipowitschia caucasica TaxID=637954 RepID=A0AAV2L149_KNICA